MPDSALIGQGLLFLGTAFSTWAFLRKAGQDNQNRLDVFHAEHVAELENRAAQRQADRDDRETRAREIRDALKTEADAVRGRMEATARTIKGDLTTSAATLQHDVHTSEATLNQRVELVARETRVHLDTHLNAVKRDAQAALDVQTLALQQAIADAKLFTAERADAAYHEANSVNVKLEKLHIAHAKQGDVLEKLLAVIDRRQRDAVTPSARVSLDPVESESPVVA